MAIVKMKRLRLIATEQERDAIFLALQRLGCVEVSEVTDEAFSPSVVKADDALLGEALQRQQMYENALALLRRYAPKKKAFLSPRPVLSEAQLFDPEAAQHAHKGAQKLLELQRSIATLRSDCGKNETLLAALRPWETYPAALELSETESSALYLGTMHPTLAETQLAPLLEPLNGLACFEVISSDKTTAHIALLFHKSVRPEVDEALKTLSFSKSTLRGVTGTAAENIRRLEAQIAADERQIAAQEDAIRSMASLHDALTLALDRSAVECRREEAKARLWKTEKTFLLTGWIPAERENELCEALQDFACACELEDPAEEEYPNVPVLLKNNRWIRPLNMVTEMYSLPAYGTLDPNPFTAPFFVLFYGIMMADMGYGLLMILAALLVMKRTKPKGATSRHLFPLLGLCGVSTFIMGALTGGFFGDFLTQFVAMVRPGTHFALPALFSPLDDIMAILIGSLALGFVQIVTGMAISFVQKLRRRQYMDAFFEEFTWWVVFAGLACAALGMGTLVLIAGGALVVLGPVVQNKGIGKLTGIVASLYNHVTGFFGDVLSYSRLMALMLAGSVIAQVFNMLATLPGNIVLFLVIAFAGNMLNFGLNLLGCYVHDLRLQCLEYFNKFYVDGGKPFRPMAMDTNYVDVQ